MCDGWELSGVGIAAELIFIAHAVVLVPAVERAIRRPSEGRLIFLMKPSYARLPSATE
jgi:hypothetical protein